MNMPTRMLPKMSAERADHAVGGSRTGRSGPCGSSRMYIGNSAASAMSFIGMNVRPMM